MRFAISVAEKLRSPAAADACVPDPSEDRAKRAVKARFRRLLGRAAVLPGTIQAVTSAPNPRNLKQRSTDALATQRAGRSMARQFIYHMQGLSKTYPGNRKVLENIHLSFYPDAKIGVLGVNGSGKSTLLRIMAGIDTEFNGEAWVAEGARVGYLAAGAAARSRQDRARERHGGRRAAEGDPRPLQRARHQLFGRDRRRDDQAAGRDRGQGAVGSRFQGRPGDGRAALPARRCRRGASSPAASAAASRSAGCCWSSPSCCCSTSRPTISTPSPCTGWKAICATIRARS